MNDSPRSVALEVDDFSDIGFDMVRHEEALTSFARLEIDPSSIRPALRARDMVFVRYPSCRFALGVTNDPASQHGQAVNGDSSIGFEVIHQAASDGEANAVRDEVARYFFRHFPGRMMPGQTVGSDGIYVYIACYAAA